MIRRSRILFLLIVIVFFASCGSPDEKSLLLFEQAAVNGKATNESYKRCDLYVNGWLDLADPETGLTFCPRCPQSPFSP